MRYLTEKEFTFEWAWYAQRFLSAHPLLHLSFCFKITTLEASLILTLWRITKSCSVFCNLIRYSVVDLTTATTFHSHLNEDEISDRKREALLNVLDMITDSFLFPFTSTIFWRQNYYTWSFTYSDTFKNHQILQWLLQFDPKQCATKKQRISSFWILTTDNVLHYSAVYLTTPTTFHSHLLEPLIASLSNWD